MGEIETIMFDPYKVATGIKGVSDALVQSAEAAKAMEAAAKQLANLAIGLRPAKLDTITYEAHVAIIRELPAGTLMRICSATRPTAMESRLVIKIRNKVESFVDMAVVKFATGEVVEVGMWELSHESTEVFKVL